MTPEETGDNDRGYASAVGRRLRDVRRQKSYSLHSVAEASGGEFKASVLGAYERGERAISVPRLQRLARLYEVSVDQLLPESLEPLHGLIEREQHGAVRREKIRIDLVRLREVDTQEAVVLQRFLLVTQNERQDFNGRVMTLRRDDLRVIAATLGMTAPEFTDRLEELELIDHPQ